MKTCSLCGLEKPISSFRARKEAKDGLRSECAVCDDKRKKRWNHLNPQRYKDCQKRAALKALYGLTLDAWSELFRLQGGRCKICHREGCRLSVDHCHTTGDVRGLLCQRCNAALGLMDDSPSRLVAASNYLLTASRSCGILT